MNEMLINVKGLRHKKECALRPNKSTFQVDMKKFKI